MEIINGTIGMLKNGYFVSNILFDDAFKGCVDFCIVAMRIDNKKITRKEAEKYVLDQGRNQVSISGLFIRLLHSCAAKIRQKKNVPEDMKECVGTVVSVYNGMMRRGILADDLLGRRVMPSIKLDDLRTVYRDVVYRLHSYQKTNAGTQLAMAMPDSGLQEVVYAFEEILPQYVEAYRERFKSGCVSDEDAAVFKRTAALWLKIEKIIRLVVEGRLPAGIVKGSPPLLNRMRTMLRAVLGEDARIPEDALNAAEVFNRVISGGVQEKYEAHLDKLCTEAVCACVA